MDKKCYDCRFRGTLPGDAHSRCVHPLVAGISDDPLVSILGVSFNRGELDAAQNAADVLKIEASYHGIHNGWFRWPWNFDPVWLENCDGFTDREEPNGQS